MNNLETIQAFHDSVWSKKDISSIDRYFSSNVIINGAIESTEGTEKMKAIIAQWHQAFPDLTVTREDTISDGNKVVNRWRAEGTHQAEFLGHPASNKKIAYSGITIYELEEGKISQYWCVINMQSVLDQITL